MYEMAQTVCLVVLLAFGIFAAPLTSEAQRPVNVPVIGMPSNGSGSVHWPRSCCLFSQETLCEEKPG
jgi:hypothetical protein